MKAIPGISIVLVVIGGLNWGLVAIGSYLGSNWNVVNLIFGSVSWLENLIYLLVGIAALIVEFTHKHDCRYCTTNAPSA